MLDLVVRGGTIVDGSGTPGFSGDLAIESGCVVGMGNIPETETALELDATGMLVTPGFIDIHSHSDFTLLVDPRAQSAVFQGVTTELIGNCGHGCAPITEPNRFIGNIYGYDPSIEIDWHTMTEYLDRLESTRPCVNVATLVPNGNLRIAAMDDPGAIASPKDVQSMGMLCLLYTYPSPRDGLL